MSALRAAVLVLAAVLAASAPVAPGQATLEGAARRVAELWAGEDAAGLGAMLRPGGVALSLGERSYQALEARQAVAALRDLFSRHRSERVGVERLSAVEGLPARGFVELAWERVPEGTTEVTRSMVFVGLELADDGWTITEIRILR